MNVKIIIIVLTAICLTTSIVAAGPYPPAATMPGSTAIAKDDPNIIGWATGYSDYVVGDESSIEWQTPEKALGPAQGVINGQHDIVCLGRAGSITLAFETGIGDRPGFDFAVFENGVNDHFLELAYVEVSSDGQHFYRLFNESLTPSSILPFGRVDTTNITGLAGKYRQSYGTPFDLEQLRNVSPLLDVNNVRFVKIIDIVGDGSCADTSGNVIYDPYPTVGSAGFDLDAVGVLNFQTGDLDLNATVDMDDLAVFFQAWLTDLDDDNWNRLCDLAYPYDGFVDIKDFAVLARQWQ